MFTKSSTIFLTVLMIISLASCSNGNTSSSGISSTPLSAPEPSISSSSSVSEAASTGDTSVSITSDYVPSESAYSNHTEISFTDKETIEKIVGYFQNLKVSSMETPSKPEIGSYLFTVSISNDEVVTTYRFSAPQKDGTLYCKDLATSEWSSMTGWIQVSDAGAYDYIKNLLENNVSQIE